MADVVNTDASSGLLTKVTVGVTQAIHWLSEWVFGRDVQRPPRTVSLAIVGLGRTGTTSLTQGLRDLGYLPIHDDQLTEVYDIIGAMMKKTMTMDEVNAAFGQRGFDAPMISTKEYVEWAATAPNVKVLLPVRDKEKWAKSWLKITPLAHLARSRPFLWMQTMREVADYSDVFFYDIAARGNRELYQDLPNLQAGFQEWSEFVIATVPPERLLVYSVKDGWGPLCEFLDKPVPDTPFPHINDGVVVTIIVYTMVAVTWIWPLLLITPLLCVYYCCCVGRRKTKRS